MKLTPEQIKNQSIFIAHSEDFTDLTDEEGNIIYDENGKAIPAIDVWSYAVFFAENIQHWVGFPNFTAWDGLSIEQFNKDWNIFNNVEGINRFGRDRAIHNFQLEMDRQYGQKINAFALYTLCCFVEKIVTNKYVFLLRPSVQETLAELSDVKKVVFENSDGTRTESTYTLLIDKMIENAKELDPNSYEVEKIVKRQDVFKDVVQAEFVWYMSEFFHHYFPIKRKGSGCIESYVTATEQRIITYFLWFFNLAKDNRHYDDPNEEKKEVERKKRRGEANKEVVSSSRFRQLRNHKGIFNSDWQLFPIDDEGHKMPVQFEYLRYSDWKDIGKRKNGKIDFSKNPPNKFLKDGITMKITEEAISSMKLMK